MKSIYDPIQLQRHSPLCNFLWTPAKSFIRVDPLDCARFNVTVTLLLAPPKQQRQSSEWVTYRILIIRSCLLGHSVFFKRAPYWHNGNVVSRGWGSRRSHSFGLSLLAKNMQQQRNEDTQEVIIFVIPSTVLSITTHPLRIPSPTIPTRIRIVCKLWEVQSKAVEAIGWQPFWGCTLSTSHQIKWMTPEHLQQRR